MTRYRIITKGPAPFRLYQKFLQFQDSKGNWRYVPEQKEFPVSEADCPKRLGYFNSGFDRLGSCRQETDDLISFTKKYPNIETYFAEAGLKKTQDMERRSREKLEEKIVYLD